MDIILMNSSTTYIETFKCNLFFNNILVGNVLLARTFFQLIDTYFEFSNFTIRNLKSFPATYPDFLYFNPLTSASCTITNFNFENFEASSKFTIFNILGTVKDTNLTFFGINIIDTIVGKLITSLQLDTISVLFFIVKNCSLQMGISFLDLTFIRSLYVNTILIDGITSLKTLK